MNGILSFSSRLVVRDSRHSILYIWISRNSKVLTQNSWLRELAQKASWEALLDSGKVAQLKIRGKIRQHSSKTEAIWSQFEKVLLQSPILASK